MPILVVILLILMVATFGFWGTLKAILGGIGVLVLLVLLGLALAAAAGRFFYDRARRKA
ncbi:MAG: hypothetical protein KDG89_04690 [Geminicoccaceae bacterium]|nr:hypothetical protein [Geminicoccaceae bacterium]